MNKHTLKIEGQFFYEHFLTKLRIKLKHLNTAREREKEHFLFEEQ